MLNFIFVAALTAVSANVSASPSKMGDISEYYRGESLDGGVKTEVWIKPVRLTDVGDEILHFGLILSSQSKARKYKSYKTASVFRLEPMRDGSFAWHPLIKEKWKLLKSFGDGEPTHYSYRDQAGDLVISAAQGSGRGKCDHGSLRSAIKARPWKGRRSTRAVKWTSLPMSKGFTFSGDETELQFLAGNGRSRTVQLRSDFLRISDRVFYSDRFVHEEVIPGLSLLREGMLDDSGKFTAGLNSPSHAWVVSFQRPRKLREKRAEVILVNIEDGLACSNDALKLRQSR